jgi:hypothetical protein
VRPMPPTRAVRPSPRSPREEIAIAWPELNASARRAVRAARDRRSGTRFHEVEGLCSVAKTVGPTDLLYGNVAPLWPMRDLLRCDAEVNGTNGAGGNSIRWNRILST